MANNPDTTNTQDPTAISSDDDAVVVPFPGVVETAPVEQHEPTDDEIIVDQADKLDRGERFGEDLKRRFGRELPGDLHFELCELLLESRL